MEFQLRSASVEDDAFLQQLFAEVNAAEFLPLQLPPPALEQMLAMQYRAQRVGYSQQFPNLESSVILVGPYPVGRVLVHTSAQELRLVDIALLAPFRGHGIGRAVIGGLCRRAEELGVPLRLSVRPQNRAARLYLRMGFMMSGGDPMYAAMEWNPLPAPANAQAAEESSTPVAAHREPALTRTYFASVAGQRAQAQPRQEAGAAVELTLTSVLPLTGQQRPEVEVGDSFRLTFAGPGEALLPQGLYGMTFPDGFCAELFLVPVAQEDGVLRYESIFNRMQWTA
jgi:GNAT superfamily N-acetyltransferase